MSYNGQMYRLSTLHDLHPIELAFWKKHCAKSEAGIFTHPAYLETWTKHIQNEETPGSEVRIVMFEDSGKLLGILPLNFQQGTYTALGATQLSDFFDCIADTRDSAITDVLQREIHDFLTHERSQAHSFFFQNLHDSSVLLSVLRQLPSSEWSISQQTVSPVITLPSTWEEYQSKLETRYQKDFKRLLQTIDSEDEISYRCLTSPAEVEEGMQTFMTLHQKSSADKATFWTPGRVAFFPKMARAMASEGSVKLYFLDVNDDPAAALFVFDHANEFQLYNSGFDAYRYGYLGVGNALILHTIRAAIELGRSRYNFLRGDENYKLTFGAVAEAIWEARAGESLIAR